MASLILFGALVTIGPESLHVLAAVLILSLTSPVGWALLLVEHIGMSLVVLPQFRLRLESGSVCLSLLGGSHMRSRSSEPETLGLPLSEMQERFVSLWFCREEHRVVRKEDMCSPTSLFVPRFKPACVRTHVV